MRCAVSMVLSDATSPIYGSDKRVRRYYYCRPLAVRRHSTVRSPRSTVYEVPKSVELERRLSRLELTLKDLRESIDVLIKHAASMQAQLVHLDARFGHR